MTVFLTIRAIESMAKSYATLASTSTAVEPDSSHQALPSTPAPIADQPPKLSHGQLMYERLGHPSAERLYQLGISFNPKSCDFCILWQTNSHSFCNCSPRRQNYSQTRSCFLRSLRSYYPMLIRRFNLCSHLYR